LSKSEHLGMGGGIVEGDRTVASRGDDAAAKNNQGSDGDLAQLLSLACQTERQAHEILVGAIHPRSV
jgi:hypothetical protein